MLNPNIFRAYDIRGIYGDTLTDEIAFAIGQAVGSVARDAGEVRVAIGRDGRLSSPELSRQLAAGLRVAGCDVVDLGMLPSPVLYHAVNTQLDLRSAVMVTGSHNPVDYNGFKIMIAGEVLSAQQIQQLYQRIVSGELRRERPGELFQREVLCDYLDDVLARHRLPRPMKVVLDSGNGVAGMVVPYLFRAMGCEVVSLFEDVDGSFPNHHPDPCDPANLASLIEAVQEHGADLGIGFDGDGDRLGVVLENGRIVYTDVLLMALAEDLLQRSPGAQVVFDVKCTGQLFGVIEGAGGRAEMWKTGHSMIKRRMEETGALLGGEASGHIYLSENWYGVDDPMVAAVRLLQILGRHDGPASDYFERFPMPLTTPELMLAATEETKFLIVEDVRAQAALFEGARITLLDGLRVDFPDGWALCRASNTSPNLVLRFEGVDEPALERIRAQMMAVVTAAAARHSSEGAS
ncbi:phosphomannomutase/phosphoglucomutase [Isoalcanivorax beigongshangi]|uniref:phosphomannomutase n=1 Tax=Isoalcanivorax beigongshangi TaxID=3238810 RepID=A0ABV4AGL9_9GAMM